MVEGGEGQRTQLNIVIYRSLISRLAQTTGEMLLSKCKQKGASCPSVVFSHVCRNAENQGF